jgi:hypothetical protein
MKRKNAKCLRTFKIDAAVCTAAKKIRVYATRKKIKIVLGRGQARNRGETAPRQRSTICWAQPLQRKRPKCLIRARFCTYFYVFNSVFISGSCSHDPVVRLIWPYAFDKKRFHCLSIKLDCRSFSGSFRFSNDGTH